MTVTLGSLHCEYLTRPLGIDNPRPSLSWRLQSDDQNVMQAAYQIQVSDRDGIVWDTGKIASDESIHIPYEGPTLQSRQRVSWKVKVWDDKERESDWSAPAAWEMGLLNTSDWQAKWIDPEDEIDSEAFKPASYLRKVFSLKDQPVERARVYATAHGVYELHLNGVVIGDEVLMPGYTSYHDRLQVHTFDVTDAVAAGENAIGVVLGDGWWRGKLDALSHRNVYGERLALLLQLHVTYADGQEDVIVSDSSWTRSTGPIIKSDMKDGEWYDARLDMPGWDTTEFDDSAWKPVAEVDFPFDNLVAQSGLPIKRHERFEATVIKTPNGETVLDFGQNIAGWVRIEVEGPAGSKVRLRCGETLDKEGNFTMDNLNSAGWLAVVFKLDELIQRIEYTLKGEGREVYEPHFSFQGFRYALVEDFPGAPKAENFSAVAVYSDMHPMGQFETSDQLLNKLQDSILWSLKGNFVDIPTDCPQRERAGWTGDAQVFALTGSLNMETAGFFEKWLKDLVTDQRESGLVPNIIPDASRYIDAGLIGQTNGSTGWADCITIIPWTLYQIYGDSSLLEMMYKPMKAWVDYGISRAKENRWVYQLNPARWFRRDDDQQYVWEADYHWGEWLEPNVNTFTMMANNFLMGQPSVATAFLAHSASIVAKVADLLGKPDDANTYRDLSNRVRDAWVKTFANPDGRLKPDKQATYVRALAFDLLSDDLRQKALVRLVSMIKATNYHIGTGFLATGYICKVLAENGYADVAYKLLLTDTPPSWLYPVTMGATTTWEFWETIKQDGTVSLGSMNHYSAGSVGSWFYEGIGGIKPAAPGFKRIHIEPRPGGGLNHARASLNSLYGSIESAWRLENDTFTLTVTIPPNTTATIQLPDGSPSVAVGSGSYTYSCTWEHPT